VGADSIDIPAGGAHPQNLLPYKYKVRSGRHVFGQSSYDPFLDANNWERGAIDIESGGLNQAALLKALQHSENKPRVLTRIGKCR